MGHLRGSACPAAAEPTDGELLERFVAHRDEGAFAELVRRHGPMVLSACRRVLDTAEDVEDAFQATFMILVRKADSIRNRDSAASWLYGVALHVARRARRAMTHRQERERKAAVPEKTLECEEAWRDLRPVLDDAVESLPEKYRVLVVLCYLQGRTYDEASRLLDVAKGTVSTRLTQARTLLRRRLTRRGVVLPIAILGTLLESNAAPAAVPPQLPPLALDGGRVAAGMGGSVSSRVAELAQTTIRGGSLLAPTVVAVLAGVLALLTGGLLAYRIFGPGLGAEPEQTWTQRFSREDQRFVAYGFHVSPDEKMWIWQNGDFEFWVADMATGRELASFKHGSDVPHDTYPLSLGFTPDNRCAITALTDVRLWDIATKQEVARFPGSTVAAFRDDGKTLATVSMDGAIHVIDVAQRSDRVIKDRLPGPIRALAFLTNGSSLAAGGSDGAVVFYDLATFQQQRRLSGNAMPTLELAFSPDGSYLAAMHGNPSVSPSTIPRTIELWQLETERKTELPPQRTARMAFPPAGRTLVTQDIGGMLDTWDPTTGKRGQQLRARSQASKMVRLVFSPDGKVILTGDAQGNALLRSVKTGKTLAKLTHSGMVADAAFTADGRRLVTGTMRVTQEVQSKASAEVKLWDRAP